MPGISLRLLALGPQTGKAWGAAKKRVPASERGRLNHSHIYTPVSLIYSRQFFLQTGAAIEALRHVREPEPEFKRVLERVGDMRLAA